MADPLSADAFLSALRAEGVRVVEVGSWRTHNRNHKGPWGPVNGVVVHHTVSSGAASTVALCRDGYSELPGPLCHGVITKDGTFHLIGYGRTNHAGGGDPGVLAQVTDESYSDRPTAPHFGNSDGVDGNRHFYGWECENLGDGKDPWPAAQIITIIQVISALCRAHGWTARSALRHLDWQPGKVDPRGPGMNWTAVLDAVAERLGAKPPVTPLPPPAKPVVDLSKLIAAARSNPSASGTPVTYAGVKTVEAALVDAGYLAKTRLDGHYGRDTVKAYAAWQRHLGYSGPAADGIPGMASLKKLGAKYHFDVTA